MHIVSSRTNRFYSLLLVLMTSISAIAQSPSKNYVQTKTFLDDARTTFLRHIDYYDELGVVAGAPMWTSVDPLAEKYYSVSPYVYCMNNPVKYIDSDGKERTKEQETK